MIATACCCCFCVIFKRTITATAISEYRERCGDSDEGSRIKFCHDFGVKMLNTFDMFCQQCKKKSKYNLFRELRFMPRLRD